MKNFLSILAVSMSFMCSAQANEEKVNQLGYPFNAPADTYNSGDLSFEEVFADEIVQSVSNPYHFTVKDEKALQAFLANPQIREYIVREVQTWENMPDHVIKSYVTAVSILNEETGENFMMLFVPDKEKAMNVLSLQKNLLPEEAKVKYFQHPKVEEKHKGILPASVEKFVKDHFRIAEPATQAYLDAMGEFNAN